MKPVEKIIVPTDLSEGSRHAIDMRLGWRWNTKARLFIMHVANEFAAWELHDDAFGYSGSGPWTACSRGGPN